MINYNTIDEQHRTTATICRRRMQLQHTSIDSVVQNNPMPQAASNGATLDDQRGYTVIGVYRNTTLQALR
jgi:hypothetical protein